MREAEASEGRACNGWRARTTGSHGDSLPTPGSVTAGVTAPDTDRQVVSKARVPRSSSSQRLDSAEWTQASIRFSTCPHHKRFAEYGDGWS